MTRCGVGVAAIIVSLTVACTKGLAPGTGPTPVETKNLTLSVEKSCNDGYTARVKAYDRDSGAVWPSSSESWTVRRGDTIRKTIACAADNRICIGAANDGDNTKGYWGIGINAFLGCTNCCYSCQNTEAPLYRLTC